MRLESHVATSGSKPVGRIDGHRFPVYWDGVDVGLSRSSLR
jgi:hypothetical protein